MDLNTITVENFKSLFVRDFPYLPVWDDLATYNTNAIVYYTDGLFYKCLSNGVTALPTNTTFWALYSTGDVYDYVLDSDIQRAFDEAKISFNQGLIPGDDSAITMGYLYCTAHFLVNDLRTAKASLSGDGFNIVESRTVGSVTESYMIPERYRNSPIIVFYTKSGYGMKYLNMILPNLVGNVQVILGWTTP